MNDFESQKRKFFAGQIDRREFLRRSALMGAMSLALVACGKKEEEKQQESSAAGGTQTAAVAPEGPKKGGTLRLGMEGGSPSDSLDPRTYADSVMIAASLAACNCLVEFDADGKPTGELFESWDVKPGAKEWVFNVRKDITFSNGKTLDADDCIYSIQIHRGETKSPAKGILEQIDEIKAVNKNQVAITLKDGNADFPVILGDYHLIVVPKDFTDWDHLVGTGAYQLESVEYGVRLTYKRRDGGYWKPNRGNFDSIEIRNIQDVAARTAALQSGEIDGCNRLDARTVKKLMEDQSLNVVRTKGTGNRFCFVARVTDDPYTNKDLRTALKYAIDREKIIESVYSGFAVPGNDHNLDALNPFYNTEMPQMKYDPDKAAFYFKKAGVSVPVELQTSEGAWGSAVDCAQLYQESATKAGVPLQVKKVSGDGYWDNVWLKVPFCAVYWGRRMSADQAFTQVFGEASDWNDTNWKVPEFQKIIKDARVETDFEKRKALYWQAQKMIAEDGGFVCFAITDYLDGYSKKVAGVKPHGRYDMDDNRVAEKAWFA